ncbi:hypothetical protein KC953_00500 [Candidatus Saccharibacteria bacterium]|nr:hypothetical protein [Candidatus Saccharibacteria bacterium]
MVVKRVHKALKLRHHKHTGKILHHRHTSYRVLFLLMIIPVVMMALVGQFVKASDYDVTASVPATIPRIAPVITSPNSGFTTVNSNITIRGTCPLGHVAGVVAIYENKKLLGAQPCLANGTFAVPISLSLGSHVFVATIISVMNDVGLSSSLLVITREKIFPLSINTLGNPVPITISPSDPFLVMDTDGRVVWRGTINGGSRPYMVEIDWGDGSTSKYKVSDVSRHSFVHIYSDQQAHTVIIRVKDDAGASTVLYSIALTSGLRQVAAVQSVAWTAFPSLQEIQRYLVYVYLITLSALVFMWYLQHGRMAPVMVVRSKRNSRARRHRSR